MTEVFFEIVSPLPMNSKEDARKLFSIWAEVAPQYLPDRSGLHEPLREKFSLNTIEDAIRTWEFQFLLKRTASPKLQASILMQYGPHRKHSTWTIGLQQLSDFEQSCFRSLLQCSATVLMPDFALIHRITKAEIARGEINGSIQFLDTSKKKKSLFVTTHVLKKYVPDVYWTTIFGAPYVKLFSRKRLLSAPVHRVEELENGSIAIQLTPKLSDAAADEAAFERLRKAVRDHLNSNAIFDEEKGAKHRYTIPEFVWGPILH
jgi:hypothetical protein